MASTDQEWLSTGQVADLCAVTPATVLNWIRAGKLEGVRTPGGHYRVQRSRLEPVLGQRKKRAFPSSTQKTKGANLRCWEYLSDRGTVRPECLDCVVFRVRATWCFQIAALGIDTGHARRFCPTSCDDCAYYRRVKGIPMNVLVVSSDPGLLASLKEEPADDVIFRFARNAYEASAIVESFLPAFAVVDMDTPTVREGGLLENLGRDPRLPGLKTFVAVGRGKQDGNGLQAKGAFVAGCIEKPFGVDEIRSVIESFPVEALIPGGSGGQGNLEKGDSR